MQSDKLRVDYLNIKIEKFLCKHLNEEVSAKCEYIEKYTATNTHKEFVARILVRCFCLENEKCTAKDCEQIPPYRGNSYIPNPASRTNNYDIL